MLVNIFRGFVQTATEDYSRMDGGSTQRKRFEGRISARAIDTKSSTWSPEEQKDVTEAFAEVSTNVDVHCGALD